MKQYTIDRFESVFAVCEVEDELIHIARDLIEAEAKEGDVLYLNEADNLFYINCEETEKRRANITQRFDRIKHYPIWG